MDFELSFGEIRTACPHVVAAAVYLNLRNSEYSAPLWAEINRFLSEYRQRYTVDSIKEMPSIQTTRQAYKLCGKDPSRYRPSGEALVRRTLKGNDLYHVSTLVDLINLASIAYGYSLGGFDADKFVGDTLTLGVGREGEPYEGIGRGPLNIAGLPVYRDAVGGVGTPTSDNERTKMTLDTTHLVVLVNGYDGNEERVRENAAYLKKLIEQYAAGTNCSIMLYR